MNQTVLVGHGCMCVKEEEATPVFDGGQDSGARQEFDTGSVRDTRDGKGRFDLLPTYALTRIAQHFENGSKKYGERNWERGQNLTRYVDSALRHTFRLLAGEVDEDHAAAAVWNLLAFIETQHRVDEGRLPENLDDMPYKADLEVDASECVPYVPATEDWTKCNRCSCYACAAHWKQTDRYSGCCQCDHPEIAA